MRPRELIMAECLSGPLLTEEFAFWYAKYSFILQYTACTLTPNEVDNLWLTTEEALACNLLVLGAEPWGKLRGK